jgi:hypothetical protein
MNISEELNRPKSGLQYNNEGYNVGVYDLNVNNVKLYTCILPPWNFYQWNDFGESPF